jgi:hypothetical protein
MTKNPANSQIHIFLQVDIEQLRKPTVLLQWMGMNALIVYALAACDIFPAIIQGFYWRSPENNLVMFLFRWFFISPLLLYTKQKVNFCTINLLSNRSQHYPS